VSEHPGQVASGDASVALQVRPFTGGAFQQTGYVLRCTATGRAAVVDPGASAGEMVAALRSEGVEGDQVEAVFLTHSHVDHVEGLAEIRAFTGAPIYLHPDARPLFDLAPAIAERYGLPLSGPLPEPERELVAGDPVRVGEVELEVRMAPGHAPGHVILHAPAAGLALVGDVIFAGSIGRTDLPGGDFQELMRSIRDAVLTLPDSTRLLTGHGPETTVGQERMGNPFLISQSGHGFA
jgi:hydroxyacylglutathione hydrolase